MCIPSGFSGQYIIENDYRIDFLDLSSQVLRTEQLIN